MADYKVYDEKFRRYVLNNAKLERLADGFRWIEGPVWCADGGYLLFSDIPNNRILRWIDGVGISIYREPANFANGHTRDRDGRLISCEHLSRRVTRTEADGAITVIASEFNNRRLNSPNDVVVKSDNTIWFTDPHYGIMTDYEGRRAEQELDCNVYRYDPRDQSLEAVVTSLDCPNGLCFSPDESMLYVADTGFMFASDADRHIHKYHVGEGNRLSDAGRFYATDTGAADGFRCDHDGNVWTSAGDGVHCVAPDGTVLGKILLPETVANVCFGGHHDAKNRLFICASTALYSIYLNTQGVQSP